MVLFFILFLTTIFLFCFPFSLKIALFLDNSPEIRQLTLKVGFFRFNPNIHGKKAGKKKRFPKIKLKNVKIEIPIETKVLSDLKLPECFSVVKTSAVAAAVINFLQIFFSYFDAKIGRNTVFEGKDKFYFQVKVSVKTNLFLIFSSIMQTIIS